MGIFRFSYFYSRRVVGSSVSLAIALVCLATPAAFAADDSIEELLVTGSRIARNEVFETAPVAVYDRDDIAMSNATTLNEFLRDLSIVPAGTVDDTFTQGFAPASAGINLRGMGVSRTLVLLDGRRMSVFPFAQEGSESFVDINLIPLGSIDRIEVLKDGASALYGADAVTGVVNIVTRRYEEGLNLSARYGQTGEGDGEEALASLNWGILGQRGRASLGLDVFDRSRVDASDRSLTASANGPIDDRSGAGSPGSVIRPAVAPFPVAEPRCPAENIVSIGGPATLCSFDFAPFVTLIPETQRIGAHASGEFDLSPSVLAFARAVFSRSESERALAPAPISDLLFVDPTNPNNIYPGEPVLVIYRFVELGPRVDEFETNALNAIVGVSGEIGEWQWESAISASIIDSSVTGINGYATQADMQAAVDAGTLNPFGDSPSFDATSVSVTTRRDGEARLYGFDTRANGDLHAMTHGMLQAAVGIELRSEEFSDFFDPLTESGVVMGIGGTSGEGDRDVVASYGELLVPVLPGVELQVAARLDHYSDFGSTFNPKLGAAWRPSENLLVRANLGTGFKAPALHELYSRDIVSFSSIFDPVTASVEEVQTTASGNADLDAEETRNYGLGVVWDANDTWQVGLDYWWIRNDNAVTSNAQYYVDNEALFPANIVRDGTGTIVEVFAPFRNVAEQKLQGFDLLARGSFDLGKLGDLAVTGVASRLDTFERRPAAGQPMEGLVGHDGIVEWRLRSTAEWSTDDISISLTGHFVDGYDRPAASDEIGSWTRFDGRVAWSPSFLEGGELTGGVDNLLDREPPADPFFEGWPFVNRALHDNRGRFAFLEYRHSF
jgi:outer membrane receptor protein involved in Fe transport